MTDQVRLLHVLGYLALRFGRTEQSIILLRQATALAPNDRVVRRTLVLALIYGGVGAEAVALLDRLPGDAANSPAPVAESEPAMLALLRSRALLAADRLGEARASFHRYLAGQGGTPLC